MRLGMGKKSACIWFDPWIPFKLAANPKLNSLLQIKVSNLIIPKRRSWDVNRLN